MTECDEVGWVPRAKAFANFRILLETTNARTMTATGVDDDDWLARGISGLIVLWEDAQQGIIDWAR